MATFILLPQRRSRRCFKEPEAEEACAEAHRLAAAAVAAVSKSLRRRCFNGLLLCRGRAAVAAVSKSLRRVDGLGQGLGVRQRRSRRCFKEPEAALAREGSPSPSGAAVAAVSKSLRRRHIVSPRAAIYGRSRRCFKEPEAAACRSTAQELRLAAVAAVSKSLRRLTTISRGSAFGAPQSPLFQRA